jgi:hypothetical protein
VTVGKGRTRHAETEHIGSAGFSLAAGEDAAVRMTLNKAGRALLSAAHGHISASLTIAKTTPLPAKVQTWRVRLIQTKRGDG